MEGSKDTPYEGGHYWGKLIFPKEYPLKPPSVMMLTPNGRFKTGRRLCLSMSDFHPGMFIFSFYYLYLHLYIDIISLITRINLDMILE